MFLIVDDRNIARLRKERQTIGSRSDADVVINDPRIQACHCEVTKEETGLWKLRNLAHAGVAVDNRELSQGAAVDVKSPFEFRLAGHRLQMRELSEGGVVVQRFRQKLFDLEDINLTFTEDAVQAVAKKAIQRKTGARGLRSIVENILLDTMFDLPGMDGVDEVVVDKDVVEGRKEPVRVYAEKKAETAA